MTHHPALREKSEPELFYTPCTFPCAMESVAVTLEGLAAKLDRYGSLFSGNEQLVRHALVCPVLREMGWDVENPELVATGYDFDGGSADYALLQDGKPVAAVRTRPLDGDLDGVLDELAGYGVRYCIATDGRWWRIRDTAGPESNDAEFSVAEDPTLVCYMLMVLWRRHMSAKPLATGHMSLHRLQPEQIASELICPDMEVRSIKNHKSLLVEVARWLVKNNYLTAKACPIALSTRYLLAKSPVHPTGKKFVSPKPVGDMYLETNFNSKRILDNIGILLSKTGLDVSRFSVRCP